MVGGDNYGQGSSREHAALAPMYLGVKAVVAKSFARIHRANLINFGILPLTFVTPADYDSLEQDHQLSIPDLKVVMRAEHPFPLKDITSGKSFQVIHSLTERQKEIILAGGLLNHTRQKSAAELEAAKDAKVAKASKPPKGPKGPKAKTK